MPVFFVKRKKQELKLNYVYVPNDAQLEQGFEIFAEAFYKSQEKIREKLKENKKSEKVEIKNHEGSLLEIGRGNPAPVSNNEPAGLWQKKKKQIRAG